MQRFERLPAGTAGGTKLCGRDKVNPSLSHAASMDEERFLRGLRARLGEPDAGVSDALYTYSVRDRQTGLEFEVYSAQSGPSYGGEHRWFETTPSGGYRLREDMREVLAAFDAWIEDALTPGGA